VGLPSTPMPAAFGSTRETPIAFLARLARARFQAEVPWDIPEVALAQAQVPAGGPAKVAGFLVVFLEQVAEAAEREPVPVEGRIFGGLHRVVAAKVTERKEDAGRAQQ
jgi:hypothetical protein